jgi:GNAT superfamily N-acetyltransferase
MIFSNDIPLFTAHGLGAFLLREKDAPKLQKLLERCSDYFDMVEGRRPKGDAALREMRTTPPGVPRGNLTPLGLFAVNGALVGMILALRHYPRQNQWYLSLQLLEPKWRGRGAGKEAYLAFEAWAKSEKAEAILLSVVEVNRPAIQFWESVGFGWPRCYPSQGFGRKRHVLIEYEKQLVSTDKESGPSPAFAGDEVENLQRS